MGIFESTVTSLGGSGSSRCSDCERRISELTRLQNEVNSSKTEERRLLDVIGDLSGRLDEAEAVAVEKEEAIESLQMSLKVEQEGRASLDADFRRKTEECLTLLNSVEMLSTSMRGKTEENRLAMEQLRSELSETKEELKKSLETITKLTAARSAAEEINASLQETASSLSDQLSKINTEKENAIAEKERADALCGEWKTKHDELKRQLDYGASTNSILQRMEIDRLTTRNGLLTQKLQDLETEHRQTVTDLTTVQENQNKFVDVLNKKVDRFKEEQAAWLIEKESLKAEIDALRKDGMARHDVEWEKSALQECIDKLTKEVADLSMRESSQKELVDGLRNKIEEMEKEKDEIIDERENLLYQLQSFKSKSSTDNSLLQEQKDAADSRIRKLVMENAQLTEQLRDAHQSVVKLQEKVTSLEFTTGELKEDRDKHVGELEAQLRQTYDLEKKSMEDKYRQIKDDLRQAVEKVQLLTEEKAATASELERLRQQLANKQSQVADLNMAERNQKECVDYLTRELKEMEKQKHDVQQERDSLKHQMESLRTKLSSASGISQEEKNAADSRMKKLAMENAELSEQLHHALETVVELREKVTSLESTKEEFQDYHDKSVGQLEAQLKETHEYEKRNLQSLYRQIREDFKQAVEKINSLNKEKAATDSELERLREQLADKQNQLVSLRIEEGNISSLYRDATKRIEILERQSQVRMPVMPEVKVQERMAVMPEIKVQKAVAINGRTSSEEIDDVTNASTPSTTRRNSDAEDRFGDDNTYDHTYDDDDFSVENSTPVISTPEPAANNHQANEGKYCDFCSEYGHDTFDCASYKARRQGQNQNGHK